jgi:hypothetical protein
MNPLPLIKRASQLPKGGECIGKGFEVRELFCLALIHVRVRLILIGAGLSGFGQREFSHLSRKRTSRATQVSSRQIGPRNLL